METVDLELLAKNGLSSDEIKFLIDEHESKVASDLKLKHARYMAGADGTPIFKRVLDQNENAGKINNKLNNDFVGEIIDTKVGYFIGIPISYVNGDGETPDEIVNFNALNDVEDADAETVKKFSICGYSTRLLYLDTEGQERLRRIEPWEVILFYDESMTHPHYAIRYYTTVANDGKEITNVQLYTHTNVIFYDNSKGQFVEKDRKDHKFGGCPLFGIPNNDELMGDFDKVINLIDAFDRALSDQNSEIEQLRLAYMYGKGLNIGTTVEEEIQFMNALKKTGFIEMDGDAEMGFVTKNLNSDFVERHLDRIEKRIQQGAKNVNFADEEFGGNLSGQALKYKLFNLETKCRFSELKFKKALRYQYQLLANSWRARNKPVNFDPNMLEFKFSRNVFIDYKNEAEILNLLIGKLSDETVFSLMSFIKNASDEVWKKKEEDEEKMANLEKVDLDKIINKDKTDDEAV